MPEKSLLILLVALALLSAVSCGDDPVTPEKEEGTIAWPDMTSMDDVIRTLVLTHANPGDGESLSRYNALLHSQYYFGLAVGDFAPGEPNYLTRAEDIASTEFIFENETILELSLTPENGLWFEYPDIGSVPCVGCYLTERQYFIRVQLGDETMVYQSPPGRASVVVIVARDESDASKWVIRAMYDLGI